MLLRRHPSIAPLRHALVALLVVAALLSLAGCVAEQSADVNQQRIWTSYELAYDANADVTTAKATFRFGNSLGTPLELTSPSEVRFNGERLLRASGVGTVSYERSFAGLVPSGTFRFTDTEGEVYANGVTLRPAEFPSSLGPIDHDRSYAFDWVGSALAPSEQVTVTLRRLTSEDPALAVFPQFADGARSVVMDAGQLRNVSPGTVTLHMTREWTGAPGRTPDAGGKVKLQWVARERSVTIY